jgi:hypothetical protein
MAIYTKIIKWHSVDEQTPLASYSIISLRLHTGPLFSPFTLFGSLPHPSPELTSPETLSLKALSDVITVKCTKIYRFDEPK